MSRKVLYLAYFFPPRGGAGVQRSVKFVKYLPQSGYQPIVVANGGDVRDSASAVQDPTLLKDLPPEAVVRYTTLTEDESRAYRRSQSKWRQRLNVTDPMGWWVSPAVRLGLQLVKEHKPDLIFVTMSPYTAAEAGLKLKELTGLPLVLDLRDPWALDETRIYPTRWHASRDFTAMARAFHGADLVIMNTPQAAVSAAEEFAESRAIWITNGYDAADFGRKPAQPAASDVLRIVHTGMFHSEWAGIWDDLLAGRGWMNKLKYPRRPINLWTRTPRYLLEAMHRLEQNQSIPAKKLELVLVGELSPGDKALIDASPAKHMVRCLGYQSHDQSVHWLESADVLFLPLHTPLDGGPALVVPGKAYEYLGSGRPILAMGPAGDMRQFVRTANAGVAIDGTDVTGAAEALLNWYRGKLSGSLPMLDRSAVERFERRNLAAQLAKAFDDVLSKARKT